MRTFDVTQFGAVGNGRTDCTEAIAATLSAAAASAATSSSRSVVLFPRASVFKTRPFSLSSNLVLQVNGVIEAATGDDVLRRWPLLPPLPSYGRDRDGAKKARYQALLMAERKHDILVRGDGQIIGSGPWWWERRRQLRAGRPHLLELYNCSWVEVEGVTLRDSPFWTLHPVYSQHVHIHHITIRAPLYAPNADGIDPDSCRHVLIEHCDISCGDDHIAIKAGLSPLARASFPEYLTQNVTVRHNVLRKGMGISIGSETSGGISDIDIHDNLLLGDGWSVALHVKTTPTRGNMVERVSFRNNRVFNTTGFMRLETTYQMRDPEQLLPMNYPPTRIANLAWVNNSFGPPSRRVRSKWICQANTSCHAITVVNNTMPTRGSWQCRNVGSYRVEGNTPPGLGNCMRESVQMQRPNKRRRRKRSKWRKFRWAGETQGKPSADLVESEDRVD